MAFIEFLKHQIQPCVLCFPTPELIKKVPNYESTILNAWENAQSSLPIKIRCVFPPSNEKLAVIQSDLVSVRENNFNSLFNNQNELESIEFIREYFYRQEFTHTHFFPDVPIGFLILAYNTGPSSISELNNVMESWVGRYTAKAVKAKLMLPTKNIRDPIAKYINMQCIPNYDQLCINIEKNYQQKWNGIQQRVAVFFKDQEELYDSLLHLKLYADLCLQRGQYNDAISAYQDIIANSNYNDFTNQAQYCLVLCDIISENISIKTLKNLFMIKKTKLPYNQYFLVLLTELFLRMVLRSSPSDTFSKLPVARLQKEKESDMLFRPFLYEQIAALSDKHYFPLYLSNSAQLYNGIGAIKLAALCYRASVECFNGVSWPSISQTLTEKTLRVLIKTDFNSLDLIVNLLNSKSLPYSKKICDIIRNTLKNPNFQKINHIKVQTNDQMINKSDQSPDNKDQVQNQSNVNNSNDQNNGFNPLYELPFPCGFVKAKITDFYVEGFPCVQINEIADEWKQTLERMFGAYHRQTFFDYDSLSQYQCTVGEEASVDVYLKFYGEIEISNVYLLLSGPSSVSLEQHPIVFHYQENKKKIPQIPSSSSFSFNEASTEARASKIPSSSPYLKASSPPPSKSFKSSQSPSMSSSFSSSYLVSQMQQQNQQQQASLQNTSSKKIKKATIKFLPKVSGELEIYGIGFIWKDVCRLESPFKHLPWKIKVLEPSAHVEFTFSDVCEKVVVGQYIRIEVIAKNSSIPLDSFSLLIKGDVEAALIDPEVEEVFNQSKMDPLKSNEEKKMIIGAQFRKEGKYKLILIFPYWNKNSPPPRYGLKIFDFKVYPSPALQIERSMSAIQVLSPKDSWALGFSGSIPTIAQHLVVVDGRLCLIDFVSLDTKDDEENELILPNYCQKFLLKDDNDKIDNLKRKRHAINNNKLYFWYQNHYGIVQTPIECPKTPVSIVMKKEGQLFAFYVTNISHQKLFNLSLEFGEPLSDPDDHYEFVVSGLSKKIIKSLDLNQTIVFKSHILMFETHTTLPMTLYIDGERYLFDIYVEKKI